MTPLGTLEAELVLLIHTTAKRGNGIRGDPERIVHQYWNLAGGLVAEYDTTTDDVPEYTESPEDWRGLHP